MDNKKKKELKNYQAGIQYLNKEYILMVWIKAESIKTLES